MMQDSVSQGMDGKADFRKLTMPQLNAILQSGGLAGQELEDALALNRWGKVRAVKELVEKAGLGGLRPSAGVALLPKMPKLSYQPSSAVAAKAAAKAFASAAAGNAKAAAADKLQRAAQRRPFYRADAGLLSNDFKRSMVKYRFKGKPNDRLDAVRRKSLGGGGQDDETGGGQGGGSGGGEVYFVPDLVYDARDRSGFLMSNYAVDAEFFGCDGGDVLSDVEEEEAPAPLPNLSLLSNVSRPLTMAQEVAGPSFRESVQLGAAPSSALVVDDSAAAGMAVDPGSGFVSDPYLCCFRPEATLDSRPLGGFPQVGGGLDGAARQDNNFVNCFTLPLPGPASAAVPAATAE